MFLKSSSDLKNTYDDVRASNLGNFLRFVLDLFSKSHNAKNDLANVI